MPLQDIGGGNKLFEVKPLDKENSPLEQAKTLMSLRDMQAKFQQAPFNLQKAQAEAAIAANTADPGNLQMANVLHTAQAMEAAHKVDPSVLAVQDALQHAELQTKLGTEQRAQQDHVLKGIASLPAAFGQNFALGKIAMKSVLPNAQAVENKDGTFSIGIPQASGEFSVVNMDPNRVGDPEKRKALEEQLRTGWGKIGEGYATVDEFYRNLQKTSPLATGPGDIATIFSYMKMLDRHNAVREGQFDAAQALAAGIPQQVINLYQRAVSGKGPVLGAPDSATRKAFATAADAIYDNARQDAVLQARFFGETAKNAGANPRNVLQPYGGLTFDSIFPEQKAITASLRQNSAPPVFAPAQPDPSATPAGFPAPVPQGPKASEASFVPDSSTPAQPAAPPPSQAPLKVEDTLNNLFTLPTGRQ